ncbi:hypothetical protein ACWCQZ_49135 [Streptomyces sp. NPDC002285]
MIDDTSPETAAADPRFEGLNVCRVAALSTMFGGESQAVRELMPELQELGFSSMLSSGQSVWAGINPLELFPDFRELRWDAPGRNRIQLWQMLNETSAPEHASAFLVAVLGSELEREAAAAAAALSRQTSDYDLPSPRYGPRLWRLWERWWLRWERGFPGWRPFDRPAWPGVDPLEADPDEDDRQVIRWDPRRWTRIYQDVMSQIEDPYTLITSIHLLAQWRLNEALRSPDRVTHSLAMAALLPAPSAAKYLCRREPQLHQRGWGMFQR